MVVKNTTSSFMSLCRDLTAAIFAATSSFMVLLYQICDVVFTSIFCGVSLPSPPSQVIIFKAGFIFLPKRVFIDALPNSKSGTRLGLRRWWRFL